MAQQLFICSIPIGHLKDITLNVKSCLQNVPIIFCEDTRKAKQFLFDQDIWNNQRLIRMDQYKEKASFNIFDQLIKVNDVAFITDAGAPAISDPGALLVKHARLTSIPVKVLGGISALTAFLSGAGILSNDFYFGGFFPKKNGEIVKAFRFITQGKLVGVWFESPKRILKTMEHISNAYPQLNVVLAKELSKPYELFISGLAIDVCDKLSKVDSRGEWVFLLDARAFEEDSTIDYLNLAADLKSIGLTAKQVKQLAPLFDLNKNDLYDKFQQI